LASRNVPDMAFPALPLADLQRRIISQQLRAYPSVPTGVRQHAQNLQNLQKDIDYTERALLILQLKTQLGVIQDISNQVSHSEYSADAFNTAPGTAYIPSTTVFPSPLPLPTAVYPFYVAPAIPYTPVTPNILATLNFPGGAGKHSTAPLGRHSKCYEFGDCSETLPLAAVASISSQTGPATEIHCLAAFTTKLRDIQSIAEDGSGGVSVLLKEPCRNCRCLMRRIPGTGRVLAGSGRSHKVHWNEEKQGECVYYQQYQHILSGHSGFLYSAAYAADQATIYEMLKYWTLGNIGLHVRADVKRHLANMWREFIVPYRYAFTYQYDFLHILSTLCGFCVANNMGPCSMENQIFRLNAFGEVNPMMIPVNSTSIPICTVFCAMGYIISNVLEPARGYTQSTSYFIPLMAILAKWCHTLCPWGHPNVISIVGITSWTPYSVTRFLLGTSKPYAQPSAQPGAIQGRHLDGMRESRMVLLEKVFGWLPEKCTTS